MRKKEYPHLYLNNSETTEIVAQNNTETQIQLHTPLEPQAKATVIVKEYNEEEEEDNETSHPNNLNLNLNLNIKLSNKKSTGNEGVQALMKYNPEDDYTSNDPYTKKKREMGHTTVNENTEKMIENFRRELEHEKIQEEEKKAKQDKL